MAIGGTDDRDYLRTLHVRNFPPGFKENDANDMLRYFGAVSVKTRLRFSRLEATAEFRNEAEALVTLLRVHQQRLDGRRLKAVFTSPGDPKESPEDHGREEKSDGKEAQVISDDTSRSPVIEELQRNVYPPPSRTVLLRIANCTAKLPKLYFEVLRLLEKSDLPSPFEDGHDVFERGLFEVSDAKSASGPRLAPEDMQLSSDEDDEEDESELEDEPAPAYQADVIPAHLRRRTARMNTAEKVKKVLKAVKNTGQKVPDVKKSKKRKLEQPCFDEAPSLKKEIVLPAMLVIPEAPAKEVIGSGAAGFGIFGLQDSSEAGTGSEMEGEFFSRKYICQNRVPEKDHSVLGPFKNYDPGQPTSRLYIKNLAKTMDEEHLRKVFGIYVNWDDPAEVTKFDLKVLKEGRMKGQAFVSLPSVEAAQMARKETNGFILNSKPMVVCFAKSANKTNVK